MVTNNKKGFYEKLMIKNMKKYFKGQKNKINKKTLAQTRTTHALCVMKLNAQNNATLNAES